MSGLNQLARLIDATEAEHRPMTERDRQLLALKLASPMRAPPGRVIVPQDNTDALPMFEAANQASLF